MKIIGLTGGIGTGKSTVSKILKQKGARIVDADATYHKLLAENAELLAALAETFGADVIVDGTLDRKALGAKVYGKPEELKKLNAITHPLIRADVKRQLEAAEAEGLKCVIYDAPLLIGTAMEEKMDAIWLVIAREDVKIARLMVRDNTDEETIRKKFRAQRSDAENIPHATELIDNSGTLEELTARVEALWEAACE